MFTIDRSRFGTGLFATEHIPSGTVITIVSGPPLNFEDTVGLGAKESHPLQVGIDEYILLDPPFLYANHSCDPNCGLNHHHEMISIRPIKPGEELLWDYSTSVLERHWKMRCQCNSPMCRKIIGDFDLLPQAIQQKYLDMQIVLPFIVEQLQRRA
jgi:hypothetical protein